MYVGRGDGEMTIILDENREMNVLYMYNTCRSKQKDFIQKKRLTNV